VSNEPRINPNLRFTLPNDGRLTSEAQRILRGILTSLFSRTGLNESSLVTGTAGADGELAKWDADGDLVTVGDAAAARTLIGAQASDALLTAIAALTTAAGGFIRTTGSDTVAAQAIVGTVSQSGGNPTGALFQNGANANGDFLRTADGTQICWNVLSFGAGNNAGAGTLADMYRSATTAWTLPAAFVDSSYSVFGLARMIGTGAAGFSVLGGPAAADKSTTAVSNMQIYRGTNSATAVSAYLLAIGRWF
jgi:hypothetical protein